MDTTWLLETGKAVGAIAVGAVGGHRAGQSYRAALEERMGKLESRVTDMEANGRADDIVARQRHEDNQKRLERIENKMELLLSQMLDRRLGDHRGA